MQKTLAAALLSAAAFAQSACNGQDAGFSKTPRGLQYRIVKDSAGGAMPAVGDFVEMHISSRVGDSLLFDSRAVNANQPVPLQLAAPLYNGDLAEGLMLMTAGDSAVFRVPLDSLLAQGGEPLPWMKKGAGMMVDYRVRMTSVRNMAQMRAQQEADAKRQGDIDDKLLTGYFAQNKIKAVKLPSGMYIAVSKPGAGTAPKRGQRVTVNYTGRTLDGVAFDSNTDPKFNHVQPFEFMLGMGQVIRGWDEGIAQLKPGSKATLYIPSPLAYGPAGSPPAIGPNSVLMFDVELVSVAGDPAPAQPAVQPAPQNRTAAPKRR